jgi:hypothetical protein
MQTPLPQAVGKLPQVRSGAKLPTLEQLAATLTTQALTIDVACGAECEPPVGACQILLPFIGITAEYQSCLYPTLGVSAWPDNCG